MRLLILFGVLQLICISGCDGKESARSSIEHGARLVTWVAPEYSPQAREAGLSGTTKLRVLVLANGEVGGVEIAESSQNSDLDQSAIASAYNCTFSPAMLGGQPTQSWLMMNCYFPPNFIEDTPCTEESATPRLVFFEQPEYSEIARLLGQEGEVVVKVRVMPDGTVGLAEVMAGPGFEIIEQAALEAARHCVFEPGILDCAPAISVMAMPYNFKLINGREREGVPELSNYASQPPPNVRGDSTINPLLMELFRYHGLDAAISDGWVVVEQRPSICGAIVIERQSTPSIKTIQIDIYLRVESDRILVESFAGFGATRDEAILDGIHNFVANSFHVLLAAFYLDHDDQVETEHWDVNGLPRSVIIGNAGIRGTLPNPDEPSIDWFIDLKHQIKVSSLSGSTHWIRCYYAQTPNQPPIVEVLLDNAIWHGVQSKMTKARWPKGEDFFSIRVFLIIEDLKQ